MKIRNGFVSNSSSSSYVVSVPKDLVVTKEMAEKNSELMESLWESELIDDEDAITQEAIDLINADLDQLKSGSTLYAGYGGTNFFWGIYSILEENDCIMMTLGGAGGDGEDIMKPFKDGRKNKR